MGVTALGALLTLLLSAGVGPDDPSPRLYGRATLLDDPSPRLYGRATLADGAVVEGWMRWDRNEASWTDVLDATKEIPLEHVRQAESLDPEFAEQQRRARSVVAFGVRITWGEDDQAGPPTSDVGIRFGHVASLEVLDGNSARLRLRGGGEAILHGVSSDLGRSMGDLMVQRPGGGVEEVEWADLERVDFLPVPPETVGPSASRLHGTLTTWGDLELTGDISWDLDEILDDDVLDGRAEGEEVRIDFGAIEEIAWESDRSARVRLRSGEELVLRGTNDVNRDSRGIEVLDAGFGRALVQWEDFRSVRFHAPDGRGAWSPTAADRPIRGIVHAVDGRVIEGEVRWDNDEERAWEPLDGRSGDAELDIEFGTIGSIQKLEDDAVRVTLLDGRTFDLTGSADVDERNRGIFVTPDGTPTRLVRWRDFDRLELVW
jgi:hypothetical protein